MKYFLGVDIGTTSVKSIAFSSEGITVAETSISYGISHPFPSWSEQDPEEIASAVFSSVENILHKLSPHLPELCSFSAAMHSLIVLDKHGIPITPSIIWADNRAHEISARIHSENLAQQLYADTGLPIHAMSPFCKILWLKENQQDINSKAFKFIGIKEWIFFKMFGIYAIDLSVAAATGFLNVETLHWDQSIMNYCGVTHNQFSSLVSVDTIYYSPRQFPALKNVPFVIGGSDGAMANVGASDEKDSLVITVGTSSAARILRNKPHLDTDMRTFCYYLKPQKWLVGGASNNGGIVLQWLLENFLQSEISMENLLTEAENIKPGSAGLIFLPYLLGERSPLWNAEAKGVLFGLTIDHNRAHMIRASMEAITYSLFAISQPLLEISNIKNIFASGGFARNPVWLQMLSDVFNLPVKLTGTFENSAWGAAKTGMLALGLPVPPGLVSREYFPEPSSNMVYTAGFKKFQRLYTLLKNEFVQPATD